MFQPKDLLFTVVKEKIKQFLSKYSGIESGIHYKEYKETYDRYKEIVSDFSFQHKLLELSHLEMVITQVQCMQNIDPHYTLAKTNSKTTFVYTRMPYPRIKSDVNVLTAAIGNIDQFGDNTKKISDNPEAFQAAKTCLLCRMEEEFIYPIYKARFNQDV